MIGLGRFGYSLVKTLIAQGHTVLGIDSDPSLVQRYAHEATQTVKLDATDQEALREVGIESYETVVVAIGDHFEASLMTCVALKSLGVRQVICKASSTVHKDVLIKVGVDRVVLPEHEGGERLGLQLGNPGFLGSIELSRSSSVTELEVTRSMLGRSLAELELRERHGLLALAHVRGERISAPPDAQLPLSEGDLLVVLGQNGRASDLIARG